MKNNVQNIFIDSKSYEKINNKKPLNELVEFIYNNVDPYNTKSISIEGVTFKVEFHPENDYFGFTFTEDYKNYIDNTKSRFKNSLYLYAAKIFDEYEDEEPVTTCLLHTSKKYIYAVPKGKDDLIRMEWDEKEFTLKEAQIMTLYDFFYYVFSTVAEPYLSNAFERKLRVGLYIENNEISDVLGNFADFIREYNYSYDEIELPMKFNAYCNLVEIDFSKVDFKQLGLTKEQATELVEKAYNDVMEDAAQELDELFKEEFKEPDRGMEKIKKERVCEENNEN